MHNHNCPETPSVRTPPATYTHALLLKVYTHVKHSTYMYALPITCQELKSLSRRQVVHSVHLLLLNTLNRTRIEFLVFENEPALSLAMDTDMTDVAILEQSTNCNSTLRCCRPSLFRLFGAFLCLAGLVVACKFTGCVRIYLTRFKEVKVHQLS